MLTKDERHGGNSEGGVQKHHHANSTTLLHACLLVLLSSLLHTPGWAGSAGNGAGTLLTLRHEEEEGRQDKTGDQIPTC